MGNPLYAVYFTLTYPVFQKFLKDLDLAYDLLAKNECKSLPCHFILPHKMSNGPLVKDVEDLLLSQKKSRRRHGELSYPITYCTDLADLCVLLAYLPDFKTQVETAVISGTICFVPAIVKA